MNYLRATADDQVTAEQARDGLGCLNRLSLISLDPSPTAGTVRAHALVQRATREAMPADRLMIVAQATADSIVQVLPDLILELGTSAASDGYVQLLAELVRDYIGARIPRRSGLRGRKGLVWLANVCVESAEGMQAWKRQCGLRIR
ncbi:hypothetical protein [Amycolatopsis sp. NPDC004625]|uniref:hypothetical protein n=1 Tax=Amycolatopsis sp. NPDC004625 TaxID=3154670 RepID=UPI0033B90727